MINILSPVALVLASSVAPAVTGGQPAPQSIRQDVRGPSYPQLVQLAQAAPLVIDGTIASSVRIKGDEAAGVAPGHIRFYVRLDVLGLIRGRNSLAPQVGYVVDVPVDSRGRAPKLKDLRVLVFARPVANRPDQLQLVSQDAQVAWSPPLDATVRDILKELVSNDAPPEITGVGNAFYVPGTLPGEGETQIFLTTANGDPVSLSILRRPHQDKHWAVALGDIVGEAAEPPRRDTLLWYRLACGLPRDLPASSVADQSPESAAAAREDYRFVLQSLGPCESLD